MRQIDIMIQHQKREWAADRRNLEHQLKCGEEEVATLRNVLEVKDLERANIETDRLEIIAKYEQQLHKVREELDKLKRSYYKLQRKQLKELQEYHQQSEEWEQERVQYQQQLRQLEIQSQALTNELSETKQVESEHRKCCLENQRLRALYEDAQDRTHSQELQLERLRPLETWLGQYDRDQQLPSGESEELLTTLNSQDPIVQRNNEDSQRLLNETTRLNQMLQAKDQVILSLENCLTVQGSSGVETLRQDLEMSLTKLHGAQMSEMHLKAELACLRERLEVCRQKGTHSKMEVQLKNLKAECTSAQAEIKMLREERQRAEQTYSSEIEGMKKEVSKLAYELHQRNLTIAALRSSSSGVEQQLSEELDRVEKKTAELRMTQEQLEHMQTENLHLKNLLQKRQSPSAMGEDSSLDQLRESYLSSLSGLEQENLELRQMLSDLQLQISSQISEDKYEQARISHDALEPPQLAQDRVQDDVQPRQAKTQERLPSHGEKIHNLFKELQSLTESPNDSTGSQNSRLPSSCSSSSSNSSQRLYRVNSMSSSPANESAPEGQNVNSRSSPHLSSTEKGAPPGSLPHSTVSRFLEEESQRCTELQHRLDSHILGLRESNIRTMSKYLPSTSVPDPPQTSRQSGQ